MPKCPSTGGVCLQEVSVTGGSTVCTRIMSLDEASCNGNKLSLHFSFGGTLCLDFEFHTCFFLFRAQLLQLDL